MKANGGFLVTKVKQLGDRIFQKILSEKDVDAFNGPQGRILSGIYDHALSLFQIIFLAIPIKLNKSYSLS